MQPKQRDVERVIADMRREFPALWNLACEFDFAERLGGCADPVRAEADAILRELWIVRTNAVPDV